MNFYFKLANQNTNTISSTQLPDDVSYYKIEIISLGKSNSVERQISPNALFQVKNWPRFHKPIFRKDLEQHISVFAIDSQGKSQSLRISEHSDEKQYVTFKVLEIPKETSYIRICLKKLPIPQSKNHLSG